MILAVKKTVGLIGVSIFAVTLLTGCASNTDSSKQNPVQSQSENIPGDPARGILPTKSDGTILYGSTSLEYPQGKAFVAGYREIFPNLDEHQYRKEAHFPLRNAQEVCASLQRILKEDSKNSPEDIARLVKRRIEQESIAVSAGQANAVYNLAIDTVCPAYKDKKLP